jgi:hypothetical protein
LDRILLFPFRHKKEAVRTILKYDPDGERWITLKQKLEVPRRKSYKLCFGYNEIKNYTIG